MMQPSYARSLLVLAVLAPLLPGAPSCASVRGGLGFQEDLEGVFGRVHTAVVTLRTAKTSRLANGQVVTEDGVGSGTLVSDDGKVLTAAHVVQTADQVQVEFFDGTKMTAKVVGSDVLADVALVQLEAPVPKNVAIAALGDSDAVAVGNPVFVVGAPLGISHTLTVGHVSARRVAPSLLDSGEGIQVLQTDAAINLGNSGGPLFNMRGEIVGVVSWIASKSGGADGLGFAVASNTAKQLVLDRHPFWSGMDFIPVQGLFAQILNLPPGQSGYLVQRVAPDSPAERLGIRAGNVPVKVGTSELLLGGDVILEALGVEVGAKDGHLEIRQRIEERHPGDELTVVVLRAGARVVLKSTFEELSR